MLAPTSTGSEFGYSPSSHAMYSAAAPAGGSGERPKLYMEAAPPQMAMAMGYDSYQAQTPQHAMTPQHQAQMHEPLMMSSMGYYPPLLGAGAASIVHTPQHQAHTPQHHQHMLHVSADYEYATNSVVTPGSTSSKTGTKRSREDLNLKEKKRMFKLNDRINQLKEMLDEAGVQTKKNKQSILDNASHYIEMLRSNLLIAKQKAERAEKQAEAFRAQAQAQRGGSSGDKLLRGVFQKTTTPRVVVDLHLQPVTVNAAFVAHTGQPEAALLKKKEELRKFLCADAEALDEIVKRVSREKKTATVVVQAATAGDDDATQQVTLVASAVTSDDGGKTTNIEFSLLPVAEQQPPPRTDAEAETSSEDL